MPRGSPSDVDPSDAESRSASEQLSDAKLRGKASMSFLYWLRNNATEEEQKQWSTDGMKHEQKRDMLRKWWVYRARGFNVEVKVTDDQTFSQIKTDRGKNEWYTQEQMARVFGEARAKKWISSNKLVSRPDRVTGSTLPEDLEYQVGREQKIDDTKDEHAHRVSVVEANVANKEQAVQDAMEMGQQMGSSSSTDVVLPKFKSQCQQDLERRPRSVLTRLAGEISDAKLLFKRCDPANCKWAGPQHKELKCLIPQLVSSYKEVSDLIEADELDAEEVVTLAQQVELLEARFKETKTMAERVCGSSGKKRTQSKDGNNSDTKKQAGAAPVKQEAKPKGAAKAKAEAKK